MFGDVLAYGARPGAYPHTGTAEQHAAEHETRPQGGEQAGGFVRVGCLLDLDDLVVEGMETG
jgi:hypothetical protein